MKIRALMTTGSVAVALLELAQFAGPRPTRPPVTPDQFDRSHRPIIAVYADGLSVHTYFTPTSDPASHPKHGIVERLKEAKESVRVQSYAFTSKEISDELIDAHRRGVDVRMILDRSNLVDPHTMAWACRGAGVTVLFDRSHRRANDRLMVIDGRFTFVGYSFTDAGAYQDSEEAVMIASPRIAEQFLDNWDLHAKEQGTQPASPDPLP